MSLRRGRLPQGPASRRTWRSELAYVIGLLVTDGYLSIDRRHILLVSADIEQLETFRRILELRNRICKHPAGRLGTPSLRVQFGDRLFHDWLSAIGFTPRKTYSIGALSIPDKFFPDFLRGHLDGDGSILAYADRYNTRLKPEYVYQRLYVRFLSASRPHIEWLQTSITRLLGVDGYVTERRGPGATVPLCRLSFAKKDAIALLRWIYYAPGVPCLARKRAIAEPFLTGDIRDFRHPRGFEAREEPPQYHSAPPRSPRPFASTCSSPSPGFWELSPRRPV